MDQYCKDVLGGLGTALFLAFIATLVGYVLMGFLCWEWPWKLDNQWDGRLWFLSCFLFCFILLCGEIMEAAEDAKKDDERPTGPTPRK